MRSSCIKHPAKEPLIIVREWQVEACDGNRCAAILLSFFEYWHDIKLQMASKSARQNDIAIAHGDSPTQDETLLQFHNEQELEAGILGFYGTSSIRKAISLLKEKDFISVHANPNNRYKFDQTRYFLFHDEQINQWLEKRHSSDSSKVTDRGLKTTDESVKTTDESVNLRNDLYTETTSKITHRDQCPLNPPKQINQEGGEEAIRVEVEILKEDQKPASIASDQKPSPLTALTIGDDQKRSAAAPIAAQQEIQVSPTEVISGAQRTDDRFNRKLHSWQQTTNEGRVQIDSKFIEYVASLMPRGKMHPTPMARNHVINEQKTESGLMKIQGYWDDWQAIQTGGADLSHHLSEADRKFLDRYNSMNVLAAKYGGLND